MKTKKKTSENLNGWANSFMFTGVILIILAFFGWVFSADSVSTELCMGIIFIFISPVVRGLSVLVQNAEEEMDDRLEVRLRNMSTDDSGNEQ